MATPTVYNDLRRPGNGEVPKEASVLIELVGESGRRIAGAMLGTGETVAGAFSPVVDATGHWEADLVPNVLIEPAGTVYKLTEIVDGKAHSTPFTAPNTAGDIYVYSLSSEYPGSLASNALAAHLADPVDAHDATAISHGVTTVGAALAQIGRVFSTVSALLASTDAALGAGSRWEAAGHVYAEAASGASDHHVTTAGGVKLYVVPVSGRVSLDAFGVSPGGTSIKAFLDKAVTAADHVVIPASLLGVNWTMATMFTCPADKHIEFEVGAKISLTMTSKAFVFGARCRLTNWYLTSSFTGPTSVLDNADTVAAPQTYVYGARGVVLEDDSVVDGYYQENCAAGIEFQGERIQVRKAKFKNIRQYQGWGSALHAGGTPGGSSPMRDCLVEDFYIEDSDRGCEVEAGASYNTFIKGHLKNVGPAGYTGQPAGAGPAGDVYANYTFALDVHSHVSEGACVGNVYRDVLVENCYGGITAVRSDGSNDSDLPRENTWENITIAGLVGTTGYEAVYLQGHDNEVKNLRLKVGSGVTSKMRVYVANGSASKVDIAEAAAYALPLVTGESTAEDAEIKVRRVSAPTTGSGYLLDIDAPYTTIDAVVSDVLGTTGYLNIDDSAQGSRTTRFRYSVHASETFAQVIRLLGLNVALDGIRGVNNVAAVKDIVTSGGVSNARASGFISRSAVAVSVDLGGASSRFDTSKLDTTLGTITDAGVNSRIARHGAHGYVSTLVDPSYAAKVAIDSTAVPITWPAANQGIGVRVRVGRRSSLTRFRFKVVTQAGNYYAAVTNSAGVVLWKTTTSVPAAGVVSLTMTGVEVEPGDELVLFLALSSTAAAVAGLTVTAGDQNLLATVRGAPHAVAVTNLYTSNTIVGATITLGSTLPAFVPLATLIEV